MSTNAPAIHRIEALLEPCSFVEIGGAIRARATDFNINNVDTLSDGVVTGYGLINEVPVYVYSQDATVLGGSIGEMHATKIINLYDKAIKTKTPIIGLIDSSGIRIEEGTDALNALARIYAKQVEASGIIPQVTAIFGRCGGGQAVVASLSDFVLMEATKARLFVNSPDALEGNRISECDTSSATFQSEKAGVVDFVGSEEGVLAKIRELINIIPLNNAMYNCEECEDNLNRLCEGIEAIESDAALVFATIADDNYLLQTKENYSKNMVTGFIRLDGNTVGVVGTRSKLYGDNGEVAEEFGRELDAKGLDKATRFIKQCDAYNIPIITLSNVNGFRACIRNEKSIARSIAAFTYALASSTVPRISLVTSYSMGSAYSIMNSKGLGCDVNFAWLNSKIGAIDSDSAARIICDSKGAEAISECAKLYEARLDVSEDAAKRGYIDTIIKPEDTRKHMIGAIEMLLYAIDSQGDGKKHGTI